MAEIINQYRITQTNANKTTPHGMTIYTPEGAVCAKIHSKKHARLLHHVRNNLFCDERLTIMEQMRVSGVPEEHIKAILALPPKG